MNKGEIYKLKREFKEKYRSECYKHPFIFWNEKHADYTGIMLTTSNSPKYKNIELKEDFFESGFDVGFGKSESKSKSYIVPLHLLKEVKYEHLEKVGELTKAGKEFIAKTVGKLEYTDWVTHMKLK
ncbi:hypothetical protein [Jiulongibacter sediminis]|uniref:Uncharacterized protein n=1 Tax=Jiulongibacter sediminis TaxID=1605367 RepID=A0A0P7C626_9BACT|nr:hypothetical protein [Jiulongibacter sediminis]KPM47690.1 hypothetical protein AFM12_14595 [Jiulongibacter sediminis]